MYELDLKASIEELDLWQDFRTFWLRRRFEVSIYAWDAKADRYRPAPMITGQLVGWKSRATSPANALELAEAMKIRIQAQYTNDCKKEAAKLKAWI